VAFIGLSCTGSFSSKPEPQTISVPDEPELSPQTTSGFIRKEGTDIESRFLLPDGYRRIACEEGSFEAFLRSLPLKPDGADVKCYDGTIKYNGGAYVAVVDLPIGNKDLHQCADAIMRLRAEYLWKKGDYSSIAFNYTSGFRAEYARWRKGERIKVDNNRCSWVQGGESSDSYESFWKYLEQVFTYAGTRSLEKELTPFPSGMSLNAEAGIRPGDVFIRGGSPGHAVIVVDVAEHESSGERIFLLAQSYMPAQELQVLNRTEKEGFGPWYSTDFGEELDTPEWTFSREALRRW
jgi:hypothetical protein